MRRVQVTKVAKIVSGKTPKGIDEKFQEGGEVPFFRVGDMNVEGNEIEMQISENSVSEQVASKLKLKIAEPGTVIFPKRGGAIATNKKRILVKPSAYDLNTMGLVPNEKVNKKYFFHWFNSIDLGALADGSSVPQLNNKQIEPLEIPLPSLSEQKAIVAKLDRAQRLIDIDREMLAKYDELIQSVFLEMFGDVFSKKSETPFEEYLDINHGYAFKSKWFDDKGDVPVVKIGTVNKSSVDFSEIQFLDLNYAKEYERFKVYPGDLLLSMTGTVGKDDYANPCIMTDKYDFYLLNQRVVKLNYHKEIFTKFFLYHFFKQDHIKRELTKFSRGIRQANLSNKDIYGLSFQKPDFERQLQFERLCDKVEQEKRSLKKSTKKSEELFSSLVQGVFG